MSTSPAPAAASAAPATLASSSSSPNPTARARSPNRRNSFTTANATQSSNSAASAVGPRKLKVVVVGQYAVGKSSIIKQLTDQQFSDGQVATIGVEFREKVIDDVNLQIWDIAGQQRASFLVTQYYRHALCAVIVADVTKMGMQYQHETIQWRDDVLQKATPPPGYQLDDGQLPLFIVFNKIDLLPAGPERDNIMQHWREFASDHGFTRAYFTSAKDYESVLEVFRNVADVVAKIPQLRVDTTRRPADILGRNQNASGSPQGGKSGDKCPC